MTCLWARRRLNNCSLEKQGKMSRKKQLSQEAIRKIAYKQTMCLVYRRTRKDEYYTNYKEAFNAAKNEMS